MDNADALIEGCQTATIDNLTTERLENIKKLAVLAVQMATLSMLDEPPELADMPMPFGDGTCGEIPETD
jgi:hypothetical protein